MTTSRWIVTVVLMLAGSAQSAEPEAVKLPPPARGRIDFDTQVRPILRDRCLKCHARGKYKGGLSLETREDLLRGGEGGPAALPGKSGESLLVELVAGVDPDRRMPEKGEPLSAEEVGVLRAWIDQDVKWTEGLSFGFRKATIEPRTPALPLSPAGLNLDNPVDRLVARYAAENGVKIDWTPVNDRLFARRVTLDLTGLLPTPEALSAFEADKTPGKESRLVAALLDDRRAYADHWLTFWNDALRNAYRGTGFIDGGRKTITPWLYKALYDNTPYDRFVRELVSPTPGTGPEGFTKGIVWRGVVNASQVPPVQAAQNVSQVFLGTNLKCASCHDSFVNHWKLTDAYALAAVFADQPLEINRCDKPTGKTAKVGFIYPQLGSVDAKAPRPERMRQLADLLVKPENGRFSRTIVNRLWAHLMGRGIVEPLDDMDQPPWSQDLLDWLAADLVAHGHDLKHTLALIAGSRVYRLPSVGLADPSRQETFAFHGPLTRRMSAEQFADAVSTVTGVWPQAGGDLLQVDGRGQGGQLAAVRASIASAHAGKADSGRADAPHVEARWVWSHPGAASDPGGRILLRKVIHLDTLPDRAIVLATCDNEVVLHVNGRDVGKSEDWSKPVSVDVTKLLKVGDNVIAAEATNWPDPAHNRGVQIVGANPAGFIAWVGGFDATGRQAWGVGTDPTWLWAVDAKPGWKAQPFDTQGWSHAAELPGAASLYGASVDLAASAARASTDASPVRASIAFEDPLLAALGRTNREQVVTRRDAIATTLQALELTNGVTLDNTLKQGAGSWIGRFQNDPESLVRRLYLIAFGRPPVAPELAAARDLVGKPATPEGVHDLLWALFMLPEFQLIE